MPSLYDARVYDRTLAVGSFWETTLPPLALDTVPPLLQDDTCEVAIIGGGITGLSAALQLATEGQQQVRVLEAGLPAWGASGRNGGFACIEPTWMPHKTLLHKFGLDETRRFYQHQRQGVEQVRQVAEAEGLAIDPQGDGEIAVAHHPSRWRSLQAAQEFYTQVAEYPCQLWSTEEMAERAYRSPQAHGALWVGVGFGLNPMKYTRGVLQAVQRRGVVVHGQSPVTVWEKQGTWHLLHTPGGVLRTKRVIVATNGYTSEQLRPDWQGALLPVLSAIVTTRPLTAAELAAQGWHTETPLFDTRTLLHYFRRLADGRLLFGGRGGLVGSAAESDRRRQALIHEFGQMFPAWRAVEITHFWTGLVCGSTQLTPHVGRLLGDDTVVQAIAFHGNGVAAGTWSGRTAAQLTTGTLTGHDYSAVYQQPLKPAPLPGLRRWYLRSAYAVAQVADALPSR